MGCDHEVVAGLDAAMLRAAHAAALAASRRAPALDLHLVDGAHLALARDPRLVGAASRVLGVEPASLVIWRMELVVRRPGAVHRWHADAEALECASAKAWVGLRNVSAGSSLHVLPGSARWPAPQTIGGVDLHDTAAVVRAARDQDPGAEVVRPVLVDGDAVVFDNAMWHGSANTSDATRVALVVGYAPTSATHRYAVSFDPPWTYADRFCPTRPVFPRSLAEFNVTLDISPPPPHPYLDGVGSGGQRDEGASAGNRAQRRARLRGRRARRASTLRRVGTIGAAGIAVVATAPPAQAVPSPEVRPQGCHWPPGQQVKIWFDDVLDLPENGHIAEVWKAGLKDTVKTRLAEWSLVWEPDTGQPIVAPDIADGTDGDYNVRATFIQGDGAFTPGCGAIQLGVTWNTPDNTSSEWDHGAGLLLHEFGHSAMGIGSVQFQDEHAGVDASKAGVNAMTTCYHLGFAEAEDAHLGRDDVVSTLNNRWRPYGPAAGEDGSVQVLNTNPGFAAQGFDWKVVGASGGFNVVGGSPNHYLAFQPTQTDNALISVAEVTVVPRSADSSWLGVFAEARTSASSTPPTRLRTATFVRRKRFAATPPLVLDPERIAMWGECAGAFPSGLVEHEAFATWDDVTLTDTSLTDDVTAGWQQHGGNLYPVELGAAWPDPWRAYNAAFMVGVDDQLVPDPEDPDCVGSWWWNSSCTTTTAVGEPVDLDNVVLHQQQGGG